MASCEGGPLFIGGQRLLGHAVVPAVAVAVAVAAGLGQRELSVVLPLGLLPKFVPMVLDVRLLLQPAVVCLQSKSIRVLNSNNYFVRALGGGPMEKPLTFLLTELKSLIWSFLPRAKTDRCVSTNIPIQLDNQRPCHALNIIFVCKCTLNQLQMNWRNREPSSPKGISFWSYINRLVDKLSPDIRYYKCVQPVHCV